MVLEFITAGLENYLQKCNGCNSILEYGTNTKFDETLLAHICVSCGKVLR